MHAEFSTNSIRICFQKRHSDAFEGMICGVALKESVRFYDAADFIVQVDEAFNRIGQPQPHQVLRSFGEAVPYHSYCGKPNRYHQAEEIAAMTGEEGTFDLIMSSRGGAEWQGILKSADHVKANEEIKKFHTTMECLRVLDGSRSGEGASVTRM